MSKTDAVRHILTGDADRFCGYDRICMRFLLATLILILPLGAPRAQTVRGAGARPCAEWTQARRGGGRDFEAEQWALGYLSGVNAGASARQASLFRMFDEKSVFATIDGYCTAHPADMLWIAVRSMMQAAHGA